MLHHWAGIPKGSSHREVLLAIACVLLCVPWFGFVLTSTIHGNEGGATLRNTPRVADRVFANYTRSIGEIATMQCPAAIAVNASGWKYVQDTGAGAIRVFDPDGTFVFQFATGSLRGIAINLSTGTIYATGQSFVRAYSMTGRFLFSWGSYGTGDGQFDGACGIAVNGSGFVYVADVYNYRIEVFSPAGDYLTQWGTYGTGEENFEGPSGIGINGSGEVYVADDSDTIKVFDQSGHFLFKWGTHGVADGEFNSPGYLAINDTGYVYVSDFSERIQAFNQTGQFIRSWGSSGSAIGQFSQILWVATNASGHVFVADGDNYRLQVFDGCGQFVTLLGKSAADPGCLNGAEGMAVNSTGAIYVADCLNNRVQVFSPEGNYLFQWYVLHPKALAINSSDCVYISGSTPGAPVEVFTPAGKLLYSFGSGILSGANNDFAINESGCVFVTGVSSVSIFSPDGAHLSTFGSEGTNSNQFTPNLMGIALDSSGFLHITNNYRVKVFAQNGTFIRCYARDLGSGSGGFSDTLGRVRVDAAGVAYVVDTGAGLVSAFAPYGIVAGDWGNDGTGGQLIAPKGIIINASGHVFIADTSRIRLFSTVRIPRPARPVFLQVARNATTGAISLQWNGVTRAISYRIYRSSGVHVFTDVTLVDTTSSVSAIDTRSEPDVYRYVVVAWNGYEESEPSEPIDVSVPSDWTPVIVVSSASGAGALGILIFWRKKKKSRV